VFPSPTDRDLCKRERGLPMQRLALCLILLLALVLSAPAETYVVHPDGTGDFPTIQAAIDATVDGDIVELTDGTFTGDGNRDIDFHGKAITVRSESGDPETCIIDCEGSEADPHRGFDFHSGEGSESVLQAVKITNGHVREDHGGAISCLASSPTLTNCTFSRSSAGTGRGGGMWCTDYSSPTLTNCMFCENDGEIGGGGMWCAAYASPELTGCMFRDNVASGGGSGGGGIVCVGSSPTGSRGGGGVNCSYSSPMLTNCTFSHNSADPAGGICCYESSPLVMNCIIAFSESGEAVFCAGAGNNPVLTCCDVYGNEGGDWVGCIEDQYGADGNICEDPLFCDPESGNFTLQDCSPCAPFTPPNPECDLMGAWPVACGGTPTTRSTWGGVKALFRE
jgi:hypothetical protein